MQSALKLVALALMAVCSATIVVAQDLAPRAYVITPVRTNAVTLSYSYSRGDIDVGSLPISGASGETNLSIISYYHSMNFLGRSGNVTLSLPYVVTNYRGEVIGTDVNVRRSGLMDLVLRLSVNIRGARAMSIDEFRAWRQKTIVGASLKVLAPTGQYDPTKLINPGANRWAFKPEIAVSRRWGHWVADGYGAVWFFTTNHDYFSRNRYSPGTNQRTQTPTGAIEAHLSYDVKPRLWASIDANFWYGGRASINDIKSSATLQANSRIGGTCSIPLTKHQSFKVSYNRGARIRFGGNNQNVSIAWQYSWLGRSRFGAVF
jgi:hypothetical protein